MQTLCNEPASQLTGDRQGVLNVTISTEPCLTENVDFADIGALANKLDKPLLPGSSIADAGTHARRKGLTSP